MIIDKDYPGLIEKGNYYLYKGNIDSIESIDFKINIYVNIFKYTIDRIFFMEKYK